MPNVHVTVVVMGGQRGADRFAEAGLSAVPVVVGERGDVVGLRCGTGKCVNLCDQPFALFPRRRAGLQRIGNALGAEGLVVGVEGLGDAGEAAFFTQRDGRAFVQQATGAEYAISIDRTGHRFAGPAMSLGATLIDADGNIARVFENVKPEGHADEVLEAVR